MKKLLASPLAEKKLAADFAEATGHPRFFSAPVFHFSAKSASIPRKRRSSFRRRPDSPTYDFQSSEEVIDLWFNCHLVFEVKVTDQPVIQCFQAKTGLGF